MLLPIIVPNNKCETQKQVNVKYSVNFNMQITVFRFSTYEILKPYTTISSQINHASTDKYTFFSENK